MFDDNIEAWIHGPVVSHIFGEFKINRWNPITVKGCKAADDDLTEFLGQVISAYGKFTATQLEQLTHQELPWIEARAGLPPDEPSRNVISTETMKTFYSSLVIDGQ